MKTSRLGILSAIIVSTCCAGPLLLILLGLGSLGIGAAIGKYHWYFIVAALVLIGFTWQRYFKEKKACSVRGCQMKSKRVTLITLIVASVVVALFVTLNVRTYAMQTADLVAEDTAALVETKTVDILVRGMTCFSCELTVSSAAKKVDGVVDAVASAKEGKAQIRYDLSKTDARKVVEAINKTGYKAELPEE